MENLNEKKLVVSQSPHIRSYNRTSKVMFKVAMALCPAALYGVYAFGMRAFTVILVSILACILSETMYNIAAKKKNTINDGSAVVTGLLLAMNLPAGIPYWQVVLGAVFAIIVVKQFFGGIGHNFMNPALAARAFLTASFADTMVTFPDPFTNGIISQATPLNGGEYSLLDLFLGRCPGCIGEVSALLLIVGGFYLVISKTITLHIPISYISVVLVGEFLLGGFNLEYALARVLSGGLILGAFFMATDYVTSPVTGKGMIIAGIICGIITLSIRYFGGYPEGVTYSILLMNVFTPIIDKVCKNKRFGEVSLWKKMQKAQ